MEKKNVGNLLVIEGVIIFFSSTLFWMIGSIIFKLYTYNFYFGLMVLPTNISLGFLIAGFIVREGKVIKDLIIEKRYLAFSIVYILFGVYIFMLIALIDSPIGPPILGPSNINIDSHGFITLLLVFGPEIILILCGIGLLIKDSRKWLVIGFPMLLMSMGALQYWFGGNLFIYEYMVMNF
ncbi:MAG: hypothetical protein ACFFCL_16790 [Promethearchaeota archaeon]